MVKNCAMEKPKCEVWQELPKKVHTFLFLHMIGKRVIFRGGDKYRGSYILNLNLVKKCLQGKKDVIFGWVVGGLSHIWLVCAWYGEFVSGLWMIWLVGGWFMGGFEFYSQRESSFQECFMKISIWQTNRSNYLLCVFAKARLTNWNVVKARGFTTVTF